MNRQLTTLALAFVLALTACSGDSTDDGVATIETTETTVDSVVEAGESEKDPEQLMLAFAACMRENGVQLDDPTVDEDGNVGFGRLRSAIEGDVDSETIEAAREACEGELEGVTLGFGEGRDRSSEQDSLLNFAICMRENGFDMPDPDFSGTGPGSGGGGVGPFGELDRDDPDFKTALPQCQDFLAGTGPSGEGPPGVSGG